MEELLPLTVARCVQNRVIDWIGMDRMKLYAARAGRLDGGSRHRYPCMQNGGSATLPLRVTAILNAIGAGTLGFA